VTIASANTPRFDHSYNGSNVQSLGLLVEESRSNLLVRSEEFENYWTPNFSTIGVNSTTSPDGTVTADKLQEDNTSNQHLISQSIGTPSIGAIYTFSCWAKAAERTQMSLTAYGEGYSVFDLSSGTIIQTGGTNSNVTITPYPNGWYRCSTTITKTNTNGNFYILNWNNTNSYTGTTGYGIYIWGAQVELASFATSYIPTVASTVTRSADNASMTGTNFSNFYNSTAATGGTISVQARRGYSGNFSGYPNIYEIGDGTSNNRIIVYGIVNSTEYTLNIVTGGVSQLDYVFDTISTTNLFKTINSFATSSSTLCFNGSLKTTDTSVTLPAANRLFIGCVNGFGNLWNGTISSLSYYPTRLTNSQLQNLTK
jgi:hypothetical protein